ncbi:tRNA pseudouridine(38-40) synthase, variant 3 [Aphanomyces invadans]|uniref:tRNA pseudouridine synthase n=1 Tax=Aphanomyces invadans TaxID=157072 RepID=A0A024TWU4_9STRA|nr:tRNA pseudouridine(38-40) synthase, variant 2 [Aphanomyces invadans]XP_008872676.1 tRNA pseudouridine(38-40) synthase, variant 3 [Aphanomyces invadans]ETV98478.1 tRNA pseudouridine(38-40) synthase, variant 2 [Aphanomyces invadans]ETV98479.1 tRNA pseudouridine(38-40) synthase, variant 3 [Aphanomyces invadans]|eukprot:XP_008872675.1 tRNA pseudouridine(38-40) synthase, variant 2 [Aphanomyces invadans]
MPFKYVDPVTSIFNSVPFLRRFTPIQQYCTFVLSEPHPPPSEMLVAINAALPESVRAQSLVLLNDVDARRRTKSIRKKYVYYIEQGPRPSTTTLHTAWFVGKPLNLAAMREALGYITGTHDFRAFSQGLQKHEFADLNTTRTLLDCQVVARRSVDFSLDLATAGTGDVVTPDPSPGCADNFMVCIEITGTGFLRHMVRRIVGTLRPIGEGRLPPSVMLDVLAGRREPGPSVPSRGLWLHQSWMGILQMQPPGRDQSEGSTAGIHHDDDLGGVCEDLDE